MSGSKDPCAFTAQQVKHVINLDYRYIARNADGGVYVLTATANTFVRPVRWGVFFFTPAPGVSNTKELTMLTPSQRLSLANQAIINDLAAKMGNPVLVVIRKRGNEYHMTQGKSSLIMCYGIDGMCSWPTIDAATRAAHTMGYVIHNVVM